MNWVDIKVRATDATGKAYKSALAGARKFGKSISTSMRAVGRAAKRASLAIIAIGAAAVIAGKKLIGFASDAEEIDTKFQAVYKTTLTLARAMSEDLAKSFNLAQSTANKMLADTGDLLVGFGFTGKAALEMADKVNRLAIDLASFTNYSKGASGASQALTKLLLGETEQAKSLGIVVRQGSDAFKNAVAAKQEDEGLTLSQAKATVALNMAYEQSQSAIGDYVRTQDGVANKTREASEAIKEAKEELGEAIIKGTNWADVLDSIADAARNLVESGDIELWAQNIGQAAEEGAGKISKLVRLLIKADEYLSNLGEGTADQIVSAIDNDPTIGAIKKIVEEVKSVLPGPQPTPQPLTGQQASELGGGGFDLGTREQRLKVIRASRERAKAQKAKKEADAEAKSKEEERQKEEMRLQKEAEKQATEAAEAEYKALVAASDKRHDLQESELAADKLLTDKKKAAEDKKAAAQAAVDENKAAMRAALVEDELRLLDKEGAGIDENIEGLNKQIAGLAMNKEDRRAQVLADREDRKADDRERRLNEKLGKGIKISKDDKAFMELRDLQKKLAEQQDVKEANRLIAENLKAHEERVARDRTNTLLTIQNDLLNANLKAVS